MKNKILWILIAAIVAGAAAGMAVISRVRWYHNTPAGRRQALLEALQPVALSNCELKRFGEPYDGGYLLCGNLLKDVQSAYSYGISGYDGWGCDVSRRLKVNVHEYDCFNLHKPVCESGALVFHPECVGGAQSTDADGRVFDTPDAQITRNGDRGRHLVVKMDVEGAEWETFIKTPESVLDTIDQLVVEFHGTNVATARDVIEKLKQHFYIVNLHFNNYSCTRAQRPFPAWAYEVLFVNKRIGVLDRAKRTEVSALNAPNRPDTYDCQTLSWVPWLKTITSTR
jgi:hypothetical protein